MSSSPVTFSPPGSFKNETKTTISSPNTVATNSEAKEANIKKERDMENNMASGLKESLEKTQQEKQKKLLHHKLVLLYKTLIQQT